jgi:hypothetical protein
MGGNHNNNNNDNLVRGDSIEDIAISRTLFIPREDIHRGRRAEFDIDVDDDEINEAILDALGYHNDVCPHGTRLVKLEIRTFAPTLVLIEGDFSGDAATMGGGHHDNEILDTTSYECRVNYRQRPNHDGTRTANCRIVRHSSH